MGFGSEIKLRRKAKIFVNTVVKEGGTLTEAGRRIWPKQRPEIAVVSMKQDLQKTNVQIAIREQLEKVGLTDEVLDVELCKIVRQNKVLPTKLNAIVEANKMKNRYPKDTSVQNLHLHGINADNIDEKIEEVLNAIKMLGQSDTVVIEGVSQ